MTRALPSRSAAPRPGFARALVVLCALVLLAATSGCTSGRTATPRSSSARIRVASREGRTVDWTVTTPSVPGPQPVRILLPADYDAHPSTRYPVLYLLHGCCDSFASWTRSTDVLQFTAHADVVVVMPDGGVAGFYSDWLRGPKWERFHTVELPRLLASRLRLNGLAAIAGISMGGRGALDYAARHPGRYAAAASFSGMVHSGIVDAEASNYLNLLLAEDVQDPRALWGDPERDAAVWRAHNPYDLAARLRGVALFVSCGTGKYGPFDEATPDNDEDQTEIALADENAALVHRLHALHIPVQADLGAPGTHTWPYWQREFHRAWPLLARALHIR